MTSANPMTESSAIGNRVARNSPTERSCSPAWVAAFSFTKDGDWHVAQCLEVDVCSQGETHDNALTNLREALELHFEDDKDDTEIATATIAHVDVAVGQ